MGGPEGAVDAGWAVASVVLVSATTVLLGAYGWRLSRTTSDFYVASRSVSPWWNASAIGGEYLSAASFLGIAGLVLLHGVDMLWFPVGYTAGYLVLLVLVAAPLRRSGAYTLPDFAEARLGSVGARRVSSALVVVIGWLYLLPQLQGAGLALGAVADAPGWLGGAVVAGVVLLNVVAGGMRSITLVQAFQYWLKLTALAVPAVFLALAWSNDGAPRPTGAELPTVRQTTTVTVDEPTRVDVREPVTLSLEGRLDGQERSGPVRLSIGEHVLGAGTQVTLPAGSVVPHVVPVEAATDDDWARPLAEAGGREHPTYQTYSLLLALVLGTMGLPHVLVRFYTNPDGRAARRTTLLVLGLLGVFYLFPAAYGALARLYTPELLLTGRTDAAVLLLPARLLDGLLADLLGALLVGGAFAAFLSTSSGLVVSVAGVLSQDVLRGSVRDFRLAALLAVVVPLALSLVVGRLPVADVVGLAFAVAASTFCPLLVLGIWWRSLTDAGAVAGLVVGGTLATGAVLTTILAGRDDGWAGVLLAQPAAWTVPAAFLVMVVVSVRTRERIPADVGRTMVLLHAPESLRLPPRTPSAGHAGPRVGGPA